MVTARTVELYLLRSPSEPAARLAVCTPRAGMITFPLPSVPIVELVLTTKLPLPSVPTPAPCFTIRLPLPSTESGLPDSSFACTPPLPFDCMTGQPSTATSRHNSPGSWTHRAPDLSIRTIWVGPPTQVG